MLTAVGEAILSSSLMVGQNVTSSIRVIVKVGRAQSGSLLDGDTLSGFALGTPSNSFTSPTKFLSEENLPQGLGCSSAICVLLGGSSVCPLVMRSGF